MKIHAMTAVVRLKGSEPVRIHGLLLQISVLLQSGKVSGVAKQQWRRPEARNTKEETKWILCVTFPPISKVTFKKGLVVLLEGQRGPRMQHCSADQHCPLN